jgi:hypothetical protein
MIGAFDMQLTQKLAKEYKKSPKKRKGEILKEYCLLTEVNRNTASKRFCKEIRNVYPRVFPKENKYTKRGPKNKFNTIHREIIRRCWELGGNICAERLHPMLSTYIDQLDLRGMLRIYSKQDIDLTKDISLGTLKRVIFSFPKTGSKKRKGNASIYKQIPIVAHFSQFTDKPGYVEIDFVEHNGGLSSGLFAVTGTYTDIFSGWIVRAAGLGRSEHSVSSIDKIAQSRIFHTVLHYHPDNDKSILKVLFERMKSNGKKDSFTLSRSRPYKKNDNAHVEQKNDDKVRKLIGYWRYDTPEQVDLLNRLYEKADIMDNFFIPSSKLIKKIRDDNARVIKRVHDKPKTPFQRLVDCERLSKYERQKLKNIFKSLDMVELRKDVNKILQRLCEVKQIISRKRIMI